MASSKKKKSPKKPAAKKKAAPKGKATTKVKAKAKPAGKKATKVAPKKKPAAKKAAPPKAKTKKAPAGPTHGDAWGNASLAPKVAKTTPKSTTLEPSGTPTFALHDHEGGLISAVGEEEELAERIHGGEEAVKNEDADDDAGSPRLDDREDSDSEE
jgi:hypothetical protein